MKRFLTTICSLCLLTAAQAQMDNVVEVTNTYQPTVNNANKIDALPQVEKTEVKHYDVEYTKGIAPTQSITIQPTSAAPSDQVAKGDPRGFFTLAGGNAGNVLIRGAYGMELSKRDFLNFDASLRGHMQKVNLFDIDGQKWESRFYTTRGKVGYEHKLSATSSLLLTGNLESQVYNYQKALPGEYDAQHNWIGDVNLTITPYTTGILTIGGYAKGQFFSRRCLDTPTEWTVGTDPFDMKESRFELGLTDDFTIGEGYKVGVDLHYQTIGWNEGNYESQSAFDLIPHFTIDNEKLFLRLGARLIFDKGTETYWETDHYDTQSKFKVAPDVYGAYHINPQLDFFGEATGGVRMNDCWQMQGMTPYWRLPLHQLASAFTNINANVGFKWNVYDGLFAKIYAGYEDVKNRSELTLPQGPLYQNDVYTTDGSLMHLNLDLTYDYKDKVNLAFKGQFNGWAIDDNNGYYADHPAWRPTMEMLATANFQPVSGLRLRLDYQFATYSEDDAIAYKRPTTSNLGASISYQIPQRKLPAAFSVYCKADNLLNHDNDWYYGYKAIGTNVIIGAAVKF